MTGKHGIRDEPARRARSATIGDDMPRAGHGSKWWPLVSVCIAVFMLLLDVTVVNVALPDIQGDLDASFNDLQWVIDAYALTLAAFQLTAGVAGDRYGRRNLFVGGIGLFALASLGCGFATTPLMLNAFRGVQGIGGSIMFASSLAILGSVYRGKDRGTAFGIWGAVTGASVAIGPLVGGALTSGFGWRWIFFVNLPVAVVAIVLAVRRLPRMKADRARRMDIPGFVLFSGGLVVFVYALIRGNDLGWTSGEMLLLLGVALAAFVAFVAVELRVDDPMLNLRLFRRPAFVGAQVAAFAVSGSLFGLFLYLTLYLQDILGYSAFEAGLRLLPISAMTLIAAPIAGRLTSHVPYRALIGTGLFVVGGGELLLTGIGPTTSWAALVPGFVVAGIGSGMINAPLGSLATAVVPRAEAGVGAGINNTFRQVGLATAVAAFGAFFQSAVSTSLAAQLPQLAPGRTAELTEAVSSGGLARVLRNVPDAAREQVQQAAHTAFVAGLDRLFLVAAGVAVAGGIACVLLVRQKDLESGTGAGQLTDT